MSLDVAGVRVGHWTADGAGTGVTVVLFPAGTVASGEIRGGAPGTREWALLDPGRSVARVDAAVLAGGSAFGLAACDGVVRWCEERGLGLPTLGGPVPIVVGCVLYDLGVGDPTVRPGPAEGYAACEAAVGAGFATGRVGAGAGATVGKWRGPDGVRPGGLGAAIRHHPSGLVVSALIACNAYGEPRGEGRDRPDATGPDRWDRPAAALTNTTIGVVVTNARLDKGQCRLLAESGHDGLARALEPVHTTVDGDALVVAATGELAVDVAARAAAGPPPGGPGKAGDPPPAVAIDQLRALVAAVVETATRAAVPGPELA